MESLAETGVIFRRMKKRNENQQAGSHLHSRKEPG